MALPDVKFAELDARAVENAVIAGYVAVRRIEEPTFRLYDGNPVRLFLEAVAALIAQQNVVIDLTGKANLLRYAGEETIGDIGWLYGTRADRLEASAATTTIRYTLSAPVSHVTTIVKGSRVTPKAQKGLYFATVADLTILAGQTTGEVKATCETAGTVGNGYEPGEISEIVERVNPFVVSAVNLTTSDGGAEREGLEAYRVRVRETPESFSVAGPDGGYWFWAKSANAGIIDVGVTSPEPGHVNIVPLMTDGELPTAEVVEEVYAMLNDRTIRPLTDYVHVIEPTAVSYKIDIRYWIDKDDAADATVIQTAVTQAVENYRMWQRTKLGRDIIPSRLIEWVMEAGARRVVVNSPVYTILTNEQIAQEIAVSVVYGGLESA